MSIIQSFSDANCTATEYAKYLKGQAAWAAAQLAVPDITWANGKSSHTTARQVEAEATEAYDNLVLDRGRFYANGKIAHFA